MEYRIVLTQEEAFELSKKLEVVRTDYVKDDYTGSKRIRFDTLTNEISEKDYPTPVKGTIVRLSSKCKLDNFDNIWFEVKWTKDKTRFEIEFEGEVPEEFKGRPTIKGWDILK
ncbi:MAG TPA: hypothetical protein VLI92_00550 [Candidatus Saccharimonadales bacterium]|nr:hypothetical protein [Candidatus Saccharimonadales bacterium]